MEYILRTHENDSTVHGYPPDGGLSWGAVTFPYRGWDPKQKWAQPQMLFDATTRTAFLMFGNITLGPGGCDGLEDEHGFLQVSSTDEGKRHIRALLRP